MLITAKDRALDPRRRVNKDFHDLKDALRRSGDYRFAALHASSSSGRAAFNNLSKKFQPGIKTPIPRLDYFPPCAEPLWLPLRMPVRI
jgi:hypothetical protein